MLQIDRPDTFDGHCRSAVAIEVFDRYDVRRVWWPASSPDLNPIENLWGWMKAKIYKTNPRPTSLPQLKDRIQEIWQSIPRELCIKLIDGMPRRVDEVIRQKGWYTSK